MKPSRGYLLVISVLGIAATGMIYQFSVVSSLIFIIGDSLVLFSFFTGVFLFSMGIGSLIAARRKAAAREFVRTQFWLAILGLLAIPFIFLLFAGIYYLRRTGVSVPDTASSALLWSAGLLVDVLFGCFTGMQLPMLQAIFREYRNEDKSLSTLLGFDYLGSFAGALAFPLILFPTLGLFRTVFLAAFINTGVALFTSRLLGFRTRGYAIAAAILFVAGGISFWGSPHLETFVDILVYGRN